MRYLKRSEQALAQRVPRADEWESTYANDASGTIAHLRSAAEDFLAVINEVSGGFTQARKSLDAEKLSRVSQTFLLGINNIPLETRKKIFKPGTKVGGVLTGGLVYCHILKRIATIFGEPGIDVDVFPIAVKGRGDGGVFPKRVIEDAPSLVVILDDVINQGSTLVRARHLLEQNLPETTIVGNGNFSTAEERLRNKTKQEQNDLVAIAVDMQISIDTGDMVSARQHAEALLATLGQKPYLKMSPDYVQKARDLLA